MSSKKRKNNNKIKSKAKTRKQEIKKLEELKVKLEQELAIKKQEKFRQLNIRNLKVFAETCNFIAPFVLTAGITVGAFKLCGGGYPFHKDDITKYKLHELDYDTLGYVTMNEEYRTYGIFDEIKSNSLVVYSPWCLDNNTYIRFKREYKIGSLSSLDLFNAVLDSNYNYIEDNIIDYKEEIQTSNKIDEDKPNNYIIEASLHMLDKEDTLVYSETELKNLIITIAEIILGIGGGALLAHKRDYDYLFEIKWINKEYKYVLTSYNSTKENLANTNSKLLALSKTKGGR